MEEQRLQNAEVGAAGVDGQLDGEGWGGYIISIIFRILQGISAFAILKFLV